MRSLCRILLAVTVLGIGPARVFAQDPAPPPPPPEATEAAPAVTPLPEAPAVPDAATDAAVVPVLQPTSSEPSSTPEVSPDRTPTIERITKTPAPRRTVMPTRPANPTVGSGSSGAGGETPNGDTTSGVAAGTSAVGESSSSGGSGLDSSLPPLPVAPAQGPEAKTAPATDPTDDGGNPSDWLLLALAGLAALAVLYTVTGRREDARLSITDRSAPFARRL